MKMRLLGVKLPEKLAAEFRRLCHLESLRTGRLVTVSSLLRDLAARYVRRERHRDLEPAATADEER